MLQLESARYESTVLFCDIRGFTALFDNRDPAEALTFANTVIAKLADEIEKQNGVVDKFTGDGFLAHFGITQANDSHALAACRAALGMRKALATINQQRHLSDQPVLSIGIGINTGPVAAGIISIGKKSEFTVLGRSVNIASRIENLTKDFSVDCLIADSTAKLVESELMLQQMPERQLRGVNEKAFVHWLLPMNN